MSFNENGLRESCTQNRRRWQIRYQTTKSLLKGCWDGLWASKGRNEKQELSRTDKISLRKRMTGTRQWKTKIGRRRLLLEQQTFFRKNSKTCRNILHTESWNIQDSAIVNRQEIVKWIWKTVKLKDRNRI